MSKATASAARSSPPGTFGHRFDQPGSYRYLCTLHPNMTGVIEVTR
jgi:plastocyanin